MKVGDSVTAPNGAVWQVTHIAPLGTICLDRLPDKHRWWMTRAVFPKGTDWTQIRFNHRDWPIADF